MSLRMDVIEQVRRRDKSFSWNTSWPQIIIMLVSGILVDQMKWSFRTIAVIVTLRAFGVL
jgi:hypothetical protein